MVRVVRRRVRVEGMPEYAVSATWFTKRFRMSVSKSQVL